MKGWNTFLRKLLERLENTPETTISVQLHPGDNRGRDGRGDLARRGGLSHGLGSGLLLPG